ncbi:hypothetical protein PFISCL1PPCAC_4364, partial [Pristionchus fissidentatus]
YRISQGHKMGGWRLESGRFLLLVTFPVGAFWLFNQPNLFKHAMRGYKMPETTAGDEAMAKFKEEITVQKRKEEYERFIKEQMAFEESKKMREKMGL